MKPGEKQQVQIKPNGYVTSVDRTGKDAKNVNATGKYATTAD
jgi:hypothetical protein